MKSISDLTPYEAEQLRRVKAELFAAALRFAYVQEPPKHMDNLLIAAHEFGIVLRQVGMDGHWLPFERAEPENVL